MATVRAFQIEGLKLWFWSNDHEPPHFHAKRSGEWEVKVHFLLEPSAMIEIVRDEKRPSRKVLKTDGSVSAAPGRAPRTMGIRARQLSIMAMAPTAAKRRRRSATGVFRVVATNADYAQLCRQSLKKLPARFRDRIDLRAFANMEEVTLGKSRAANTVYVSRLADLPDESVKMALRAAGQWKHLLFLESLPVEAMPVRLLPLDIRNPHRLHLAAQRSPKRIRELIYRLFRGMAQDDGSPPIVDAWVEDENLVLLSPSFDRLAVPLTELATFLGTDRGEIEVFEIDEDGRFLFWPHADVHLGWEQLVQIVDPAAGVAAKQRSREFNQRYGAAIRAVREEQGLKQADVSGVTERHLRRVEHGEQPASKAILDALASAHGLSLNGYLKRLAERTDKTTR